MATSDYGNEIEEDLNGIVGFNEKFNNAIVRHSLDLKGEAIFCNPNPIDVTFHDLKKFYLVNPVIGKLATQVKASKLTDFQLTKKLLEQGEVDKLQLRLDALKHGINKDYDDNENRGSRGSGGGGDDGTSGAGPPLPRTPQQEMDHIVRRLDILRGNTPDVSPDNTAAQNSRIIAWKNQERFQNRKIKEREKELSNIPKGIINKRKSSINFNFPYTSPYTPPQRSNRRDFPPQPNFDEEDFPPPPPHFLEPTEPRETSFLFSDGNPPESLSPLRNKLPNIAPLPSRPTIDNFARSNTQMTDEKNNTIAITSKKPLPKVEERNLSEQLQSIFPDVNETITKESETFKEKIEDLDKIVDNISNIDDDQDEQKIFEFEFFTGRFNQNFDSLVRKFGLSSENIEFLDILQWDYCKEILENNDLKIHIETDNNYYKNNDTNESIFEFMKNQQGSSKGKINSRSFKGNYNDYYRWILNDYDVYEKTKLDLLTFRNTKYLLYCFNDMLKSTGQPTIKIKHSKVTNDYIAAEEIQNPNWQYFIERVIEVCKSKEIGSWIKKSEDFLLTTVENVTVVKKSYETLYNIVERNH